MKCGKCEIFEAFRVSPERGTCIRGSLTGECDSSVDGDQEMCDWMVGSLCRHQNRTRRRELRKRWDRLRAKGKV